MPAEFVREIEPMPSATKRPTAGSGWTCKVCGQKGHTARSCAKRRAGAPVVAQAGHKKRKPITRNDPPVKRGKASASDPLALIRAEIARRQEQIAWLERAARCLGGDA